MKTVDALLAGALFLAIVAVIVSQSSATSGAITGLGSALTGLIKQIMSPLATAQTYSSPANAPGLPGLSGLPGLPGL